MTRIGDVDSQNAFYNEMGEIRKIWDVVVKVPDNFLLKKMLKIGLKLGTKDYIL